MLFIHNTDTGDCRQYSAYEGEYEHNLESSLTTGWCRRNSDLYNAIPSTSPTSEYCKVWCESAATSWNVKCSWNSCRTCSECFANIRDPTFPPSYQPIDDPTQDPLERSSMDFDSDQVLEPSMQPWEDPTRNPTMEPTDEPSLGGLLFVDQCRDFEQSNCLRMHGCIWGNEHCYPGCEKKIEAKMPHSPNNSQLLEIPSVGADKCEEICVTSTQCRVFEYDISLRRCFIYTDVYEGPLIEDSTWIHGTCGGTLSPTTSKPSKTPSATPSTNPTATPISAKPTSKPMTRSPSQIPTPFSCYDYSYFDCPKWICVFDGYSCSPTCNVFRRQEFKSAGLPYEIQSSVSFDSCTASCIAASEYILLEFEDATMVTCSSSYQIAVVEGVSISGCKSRCSKETECNYFLFNPAEDETSYCEMFSDCTDLESLLTFGETYKREPIECVGVMYTISKMECAKFSPPVLLSNGFTFNTDVESAICHRSPPSKSPSFAPSPDPSTNPSQIPTVEPTLYPSIFGCGRFDSPQSCNPDLGCVWDDFGCYDQCRLVLRHTFDIAGVDRLIGSTTGQRVSVLECQTRCIKDTKCGVFLYDLSSYTCSLYPGYFERELTAHMQYTFGDCGGTLPPSICPSVSPSERPSVMPSNSPTTKPTKVPTSLPSVFPSEGPSVIPSQIPSNDPSTSPSTCPTMKPSKSPHTSLPSNYPSTDPTKFPTFCPSASPSSTPTEKPSTFPSTNPSSKPTHAPITMPSASPSVFPSTQPYASPSADPSSNPTRRPSALPSTMPSSSPSTPPSIQPTESPSRSPSVVPSIRPSVKPSLLPSTIPTQKPSNFPSSCPSATGPSIKPTHTPSPLPSGCPSLQPTEKPSFSPSSYPSTPPSSNPSFRPSFLPSISPSKRPTQPPTTTKPTNTPSDFPIDSPTQIPSIGPSSSPTVFSCFNHGVLDCPTGCVFNGYICSSSCDIILDSKPTSSALPYAEMIGSFDECHDACMQSPDCAWFLQSENACKIYGKSAVHGRVEDSAFHSIGICRREHPSSAPSPYPSLSTPSVSPSIARCYHFGSQNTCDATKGCVWDRVVCVDGCRKSATIRLESSDDYVINTVSTIAITVEKCESSCVLDIACRSFVFQISTRTCATYNAPYRGEQITDFDFVNGDCGGTLTPSVTPSFHPSLAPLIPPSSSPSIVPSVTIPSVSPSLFPTRPTFFPSTTPSLQPSTGNPSVIPTKFPTFMPSSYKPTIGAPSLRPTTLRISTLHPSTTYPSVSPTITPSTILPTTKPTTSDPSCDPTFSPTVLPTTHPSDLPTFDPTTRQPSPEPTPFSCFNYGAEDCPTQCAFAGLVCSPSCDILVDTISSPVIDPYVRSNKPFDQCHRHCIMDSECGWFLSDGTGCLFFAKGAFLGETFVSLGHSIGLCHRDSPSNVPTEAPTTETCAHSKTSEDCDPTDGCVWDDFVCIEGCRQITNRRVDAKELPLEVLSDDRMTIEKCEQMCVREIVCNSFTYQISAKICTTYDRVARDSLVVDIDYAYGDCGSTLPPSLCPSVFPSGSPLVRPSPVPSQQPINQPTYSPSISPSDFPTAIPSENPTSDPTLNPTLIPTEIPTCDPTHGPTINPSASPSCFPTYQPTTDPSKHPTNTPTSDPTGDPTTIPTEAPTRDPTTLYPTTSSPTAIPSTSHPSPDPTPFSCFDFGSEDCPPECAFTGIICSPSCDIIVDTVPSPPTEPYSLSVISFDECHRICILDSECGWFLSDGTDCMHFARGAALGQMSISLSHSIGICHRSPPSVSPTEAPTWRTCAHSANSQDCDHTKGCIWDDFVCIEGCRKITNRRVDLPASDSVIGTFSNSQMTIEKCEILCVRDIICNSFAYQISTKTCATFDRVTRSSLTVDIDYVYGDCGSTLPPSVCPSVFPTDPPVVCPSTAPSKKPSVPPTNCPTDQPSIDPTSDPTCDPTYDPTSDPILDPTGSPTLDPTTIPSETPTFDPTNFPTSQPSIGPTSDPTCDPTSDPSLDPTSDPSGSPTLDPTIIPSEPPTLDPTNFPTYLPSIDPTSNPTSDPTSDPTMAPTEMPTNDPTHIPTISKPSMQPSAAPVSSVPSTSPSKMPTTQPSISPTLLQKCFDFDERDCPQGCVFDGFLCTPVCSVYRLQAPDMNETLPYTQLQEDQWEACEGNCIADQQCWIFIYRFDLQICSLYSGDSFYTDVISDWPEAMWGECHQHSPSTFPSELPSESSGAVTETLCTTHSHREDCIMHRGCVWDVHACYTGCTRDVGKRTLEYQGRLVVSSMQSLSDCESSCIEEGECSFFEFYVPNELCNLYDAVYDGEIEPDSEFILGHCGATLPPSASPTDLPSLQPSISPSTFPSCKPSLIPSLGPSGSPSVLPSAKPSVDPSVSPSESPSLFSCFNYDYIDCPQHCVYTGFMCAPNCEVSRYLSPKESESIVILVATREGSASECERICISNQSCAAFTFIGSRSLCSQYAEPHTEMEANSDVISGICRRLPPTIFPSEAPTEKPVMVCNDYLSPDSCPRELGCVWDLYLCVEGCSKQIGYMPALFNHADQPEILEFETLASCEAACIQSVACVQFLYQISIMECRLRSIRYGADMLLNHDFVFGGCGSTLRPSASTPSNQPVTSSEPTVSIPTKYPSQTPSVIPSLAPSPLPSSQPSGNEVNQMFHLTGIYQDVVGEDPNRYLKECDDYWRKHSINVRCIGVTPVSTVRRRLSDGILLTLKGLPSQLFLAEESLRAIGFDLPSSQSQTLYNGEVSRAFTLEDAEDSAEWDFDRIAIVVLCGIVLVLFCLLCYCLVVRKDIERVTEIRHVYEKAPYRRRPSGASSGEGDVTKIGHNEFDLKITQPVLTDPLTQIPVQVSKPKSAKAKHIIPMKSTVETSPERLTKSQSFPKDTFTRRRSRIIQPRINTLPPSRIPYSPYNTDHGALDAFKYDDNLLTSDLGLELDEDMSSPTKSSVSKHSATSAVISTPSAFARDLADEYKVGKYIESEPVDHIPLPISPTPGRSRHSHKRSHSDTVRYAPRMSGFTLGRLSDTEMYRANSINRLPGGGLRVVHPEQREAIDITSRESILAKKRQSKEYRPRQIKRNSSYTMHVPTIAEYGVRQDTGHGGLEGSSSFIGSPCRHGCPVLEDAEHVLMHCPHFEKRRHRLKRLCLRRGVEYTFTNLLCHPKLQHEVEKLVVAHMSIVEGCKAIPDTDQLSTEDEVENTRPHLRTESGISRTSTGSGTKNSAAEGHTDILEALERAFLKDKFNLICPNKEMRETEALEWLKLISRGREAFEEDTMKQYATERIMTYGHSGMMTLSGFLNFYRDLKANLRFKFDQEMQNMRTYEGGHFSKHFSIGDPVMVFQKSLSAWVEGRVVNRIKNTYNVRIGSENKLFNRKVLLDRNEFESPSKEFPQFV